METLVFALNVVLPLCLIMIVGYFLRRINFYNNEFLKIGNNLVFKVFLPSLLFNNIYNSNFKQDFNPRLLFFIVVIVFIIILLSFITVHFLEKDDRKKGVIIQAIYRSNFVIYGIPLCINIFGPECASTVSSVVAFVIPMFNFYAVFILSIYSNKSDGKKFSLLKVCKDIAKNPLVIASLLGILTSLFEIKLPLAVSKTISDLAKVATPLALLFLGGDFEFKSISAYKVQTVVVTFIRLVVVPSVAIICAVLLGFKSYELGTIIAVFASPIAVSSYVMAQNVGADSNLAGILVAITTAFSAFTLFFIVYILRLLNLI